MDTILFPLEISTPATFIFHDSYHMVIGYLLIGSQPFHRCQSHLFADSNIPAAAVPSASIERCQREDDWRDFDRKHIVIGILGSYSMRGSKGDWYSVNYGSVYIQGLCWLLSPLWLPGCADHQYLPGHTDQNSGISCSWFRPLFSQMQKIRSASGPFSPLLF